MAGKKSTEQGGSLRTPHGFYGAEDLTDTAAYCRKHRKAMTVRVLRKRNCLGRQCHWLVKHPEHPFWSEQAERKEKRRERKRRLEEQYLEITGRSKKND